MSPYEIQPLEQIFARIDVATGHVDVTTCFTLTHQTERIRKKIEDVLHELRSGNPLEFTDGFVHMNIVLEPQQHRTFNTELVDSLRFVLATVLGTRNKPSAEGEMPDYFMVRGQHSMLPELPKRTHPELVS